MTTAHVKHLPDIQDCELRGHQIASNQNLYPAKTGWSVRWWLKKAILANLAGEELPDPGKVAWDDRVPSRTVGENLTKFSAGFIQGLLCRKGISLEDCVVCPSHEYVVWSVDGEESTWRADADLLVRHDVGAWGIYNLLLGKDPTKREWTSMGLTAYVLNHAEDRAGMADIKNIGFIQIPDIGRFEEDEKYSEILAKPAAEYTDYARFALENGMYVLTTKALDGTLMPNPLSKNCDKCFVNHCRFAPENHRRGVVAYHDEPAKPAIN